MSYIVPQIKKYTATQDLTVNDVVEMVTTNATKSSDRASMLSFLQVIANTSSNNHIEKINTDRFLLVYTGTSNYCTAIVYNSSTNAFGTAVVLNASSATETSLVKITTDKAIITFANSANSNYLSGIVITVSNVTISKGSIQVLANEIPSSLVSSCLVSTDKIITTYHDTTNYYLKAIASTISNTTITSGTPVAINSIVSSSERISTVDTDKAIIVFSDGSVLLGNIITAIGTVITYGTETSVKATTISNFRLTQIDTNKTLLFFANTTTNYATATIITTSGTGFTVGTLYTMESVAINGTYISIKTINTTTAYALFYYNTAKIIALRILDVSGTVVASKKLYNNIDYNVTYPMIQYDTDNKYVYMVTSGTTLKQGTFEVGYMIKPSHQIGIVKKTTVSSSQAPIAIFPITT